MYHAPSEDAEMAKLWLLTGDIEAPGWNALRQDMKDDKVEPIHLDPKVWAVIEADDPPTDYEGIQAEDPTDGVYLDPNGSPLYLVNGAIVSSAEDVINALGKRAQALLEQIGDAHTVLERMGRAF
jgi:hypothetical protein